MRIYVTLMSNNEPPLLSALRNHGHEIIYIADNEFSDYEYVGIYEAIRSCDCLLAFTDSGTLSSTWRASEITYAMWGMGTPDNVEFHIPVFFYVGLDDYHPLFISGLVNQPDVYVLPNEISAAVELITILSRKD